MEKRMKRLFVGLAALAIAGVASAGGPGAVRKRVEASMILTGNVTIAPDGSVASYEIDKKDKVPADVLGLVQNTAAAWRFEPVLRDGHAVNARAPMSLRIVARREGADSSNFVARVAGATFGDEHKDGEQISYAERKAPGYPMAAVTDRVEGVVILLMKVGHDGKVVDVSAEQVNLGVVGSDPDMRVWRKALAGPSVLAARDWTFHIPSSGPHANDPFYIVRAPVMFRLNRNGAAADTYGQWTAYVPGPKETADWVKEDRKDSGSTDALPDGQLSLVGSGLKLLTPVSSS
jgi:hypothetical protein